MNADVEYSHDSDTSTSSEEEDTSKSVQGNKSYNWKKKDMDKITHPWNLPKPSLNTYDSPRTMFEKYLTPDLCKLICEQSSLYATSKGRNFTMDEEKLKRFITILLISGYVEVPRYQMYWQMNDDCHNNAISSLMSKNEFEKCMQNLHIADNNTLPTNDKYGKIRPLITHLNDSCLENFFPEQDISVDEGMVAYYGKHPTKQFIKGKPTKFGYKMWCATTRLGYLIQFEPYQGQGTFVNDKSLGLGGTVVKELLQDIPRPPQCTYHILFDNFFTSLPLLAFLSKEGYAATGTLRKNRMKNAPLSDAKNVEKKERGWHEVITDSNNKISIVRWNDNKCVMVASTFTGVYPMQHASRFIRSEKKKKSIPMPNAIAVYNHSMGGVDRFDQNMAYYSINLRTKKWWWPFFRFTVDLCKYCCFSNTNIHIRKYIYVPIYICMNTNILTYNSLLMI